MTNILKNKLYRMGEFGGMGTTRKDPQATELCTCGRKNAPIPSSEPGRYYMHLFLQSYPAKRHVRAPTSHSADIHPDISQCCQIR